MLDQSCFWEYKDTFIWGGVGCTFFSANKRKKITKIEKKASLYTYAHTLCYESISKGTLFFPL